MFYVYEWYDKKSGVVIYIGKGCNKRYLSTRKRNKLFSDYISQHDCASRIVREFESEEDALKFEREQICIHKKYGECFCNLDDGGTGGVNFIWTEEMRKYKSQNNPMKRQDQKQRMIKANPMKNKDISTRVAAKKSRAVVIKGITFESTKAAGEHFNRHPEQIQTWCKRGYDSDKEPCRYVDEVQKNFELITTSSKKVIVDGILYKSVKEAANHYGVWSETIIRAIKNNRTFKDHTCKYDDQQPSQGNSDNSTLEGSTTNE